MKLVELLATCVKEWDESTQYIYQDGNDTILCVSRGIPKYKEGWDAWDISPDSVELNYGDSIYGAEIGLSSDYTEALIDRAQWQAERDRQNGSEWKRHRGGKQPVADDVRVEVKLRDGDIQEAKASAFLWNHSECDVYENIMQYRVISQTQAEEVDVTEFKIPEGAKVEFARGSKIDPPKDHEWQTIGYVPELKKPESSGPLAWRDTVNELDAYIEEFTREREALINRLAEEGFALIPAMTAVMGVAPFSLPYAEWKIGDLVTSKTDYNKQLTQGKQYKLTRIYEQYGTNRISIESDDKGAGNGWIASNFKFHSRP